MNIEHLYFLFFAFLMGLRHGLDPDHLAIINGITMQEIKQKTSKWNGFMFSIGHGFTVTLVGVFIASVAGSNLFSGSWLILSEWIPIALLLFTGLYNAYLLLQNRQKDRINPKLKFLNNRPGLFKMFLVGVLFALVFDTASQTATWTLAMQQNQKIMAAIIIGFVFTFGMVITDTSNGILFSKAYQNNGHHTAKLQKILGWLVVGISILLGLHQLLDKLKIEIPVSDTSKTLMGLLIILFTLYVQFFSNQKIKSDGSS